MRLEQVVEERDKDGFNLRNATRPNNKVQEDVPELSKL